ncbi:hypothetical protein J6R97_01445 [bacterium]|nr:hypothetical protein [bacterium]
MAITGINQNPYLNQKLGMLTVQPRISGPERVAGGPLAGGQVAGEDGATPISQGLQGVGLGTNYAEGLGSHYTYGVGHGNHTKWFVG